MQEVVVVVAEVQDLIMEHLEDKEEVVLDKIPIHQLVLLEMELQEP
jgi:hypothetical protein